MVAEIEKERKTEKKRTTTICYADKVYTLFCVDYCMICSWRYSFFFRGRKKQNKKNPRNVPRIYLNFHARDPDRILDIFLRPHNNVIIRSTTTSSSPRTVSASIRSSPARARLTSTVTLSGEYRLGV